MDFGSWSRDCEFLFQLSETVKNVFTPQVGSGLEENENDLMTSQTEGQLTSRDQLLRPVNHHDLNTTVNQPV